MLGDGEPPLGDDAGKNYHDEEDGSFFVVIREVCFHSPWRRMRGQRRDCRKDDKRANSGFFFAIDRENIGVIKSRLAP